MKRKGLGVIESIVAVAILAIFMLLASPMVKNYRMVYDRTNLQNRIDYEFGKTLEIIKRKVRASRRIDTGDLASVANAIEVVDNPAAGVIVELKLLVPNESLDVDKNYIAFRVKEDDGGNRSLVYVTNPNGYVTGASETETELIEYLDDTDYDDDDTDDYKYFEYRDGDGDGNKDVVLIYLDLDIDRMTGQSIEGERDILDKIRDSAVTRINIDMSKNF